MKGKRDSISTLKSLFIKDYETVNDKIEPDHLKSEYIVQVMILTIAQFKVLIMA